MPFHNPIKKMIHQDPTRIRFHHKKGLLGQRNQGAQKEEEGSNQAEGRTDCHRDHKG